MPDRILVIPDLHFPYHHPNFFKDLTPLLKSFKPQAIVQMGDICDFHAINRHELDPDAPDIITEIAQANIFIKKLANMIPKDVRVYMCIGNHDNRIERRATGHGVPRAFLKRFEDLVGIPPHWQVAFEHKIDDIVFMHGKSPVRGKTGMAYGCNTVQGHFHSKLEICYLQSPTRVIWSVFTGAAVDDDSLAMAYGKNNLEKGAYGFVLIEKGTPRIIPGTKLDKR